MKSHYYGPRDRSKVHRIDTYDTRFEVIVCHNIQKARNTRSKIKLLEGGYDCEDSEGLVDSCRSKVCLFLKRDRICHSTIAHEVLHATHRLLEWAGVVITPDHHEAHAHLCGYLTQLVYEDLKSWKIKIRTKVP